VAAPAIKFTNRLPACAAILFASRFAAAMERTNRKAGQSINDPYLLVSIYHISDFDIYC